MRRREKMQMKTQCIHSRGADTSAASLTRAARSRLMAEESQGFALNFLAIQFLEMGRGTTRTMPFPSCVEHLCSASMRTRGLTLSRCSCFHACLANFAPTSAVMETVRRLLAFLSTLPVTLGQLVTWLLQQSMPLVPYFSVPMQPLGHACTMATRTS